MSRVLALRRATTARDLGFLAGAGVAVAALFIVAWQTGTASSPGSSESHPLPAAVTETGLVARSGVRITEVSVTAQGGLIDLRYQVVDPGKAASIHDPDTPPALVHAPTGAVLDDLFMGHAHGGQFKAGVIYYLIFNNPGNVVHSGDWVSVVLGDARVDRVRVR